MFKLAKATGARVVNNIDELTASDLGSADLAEERKVETDKWVFIEGCKNPKAVSILIQGGSQRVVDEAERSVHDAIMVVKDVLEYPYVIAGGGAPEALVAARLRDWSGSLSGRTQIAAYRFAEAIEAIPITLAENAGMDPLDTQVQLRARVAESLERSGQGRAEIVKAKYGINVIEGKVADVSKQNIFEPLAVKEQVINSATEAASMILRIDDVITASKSKSEGHAGRGGMGAGGGEMGDFGE
jgi:chaperonin GroEL (HSP60 family)